MLVQRAWLVAVRGTAAPDRARPGRISVMAADHVEVQLAHDVAQRADVDLLHPVGALQGLAGAVELGAQLVLLLAVQLDPLGDPGQARYQYQPRESSGS